VRIYGDEGRLSAALEELGYSETDSFDGAKINVIRTANDKLVLPYLDGDEQGVTLRGNKLRITGECYDWRATGTNGLAEGEEEERRRKRKIVSTATIMESTLTVPLHTSATWTNIGVVMPSQLCILLRG
jgi:hypothetical protein